MKNRTNRLLFLGFLLSLALCGLSFLLDIRWLLFLPVLPAFCVQLLMCRLKRWRALPLLLTAAMAALGFYFSQQPSFGAGIFGTILLFACISPTVGCGVAWLFSPLPKSDL